MKANKSRGVASGPHSLRALLVLPMLIGGCRPETSATAQPSAVEAQAEGEDATVEIETTDESSSSHAVSPEAEAQAKTKTPNEDENP